MSSSNPPTNKARPIHITREIRETPDQSEPSYSYEDTAFLADLGDDEEERFHRRLTLNGNRRTSFGGGATGGTASIAGVSTSSGGSFWRTATADDATPSPLPSKPVTLKERKSSGGLLGAALQLHSQSSTASDEKKSLGGSSPVRKTGSNPEIVSARLCRETDINISWDFFLISIFLCPLQRKSASKNSVSFSPSPTVGISNAPFVRDIKKNITKQRAEARRLKLDSQLSDVDIGHVVDDGSSVGPLSPASPNLSNLAAGENAAGDVSVATDTSSEGGTLGANSVGSTIRTNSGGSSTPSGMNYSNTSVSTKSRSGAPLGKGSSLLFPTGVDNSKNGDDTSDARAVRRQKINLLLDQCESVRWPYKKKLVLAKLGLKGSDIPVKDLYNTNLGKTLHKLSLSGNRLASIPPKLVICLPTLKSLDLSQCQLHQLPERWKLPQLKRLNLSHNLLTEFPEEVRDSQN